ncbi:hypothetical protein Q8A73_001001 [Channa argus]|nr:hypothetical protein Q8A73_001001 [Channa argus]
MVVEMEGKDKPRPSPDYLMQLMNDKKLMSSLPNFCGIFQHLERLLDEEISRVRKDMYNDTLNGSEKKNNELPEAVGPTVQLQEKLYVPVKDFPDAEGEDSLKKMQLMELAILNGTYRDANIKPSSLAFSLAATTQTPRVLSGPAPVLAPPTALRTPAPTGPALMPLIRQIQAVLPNGTPALMQGAGPEAGLIYAAPYEYPYALAPASILEYPLDSGGVLGKPAPACSCDCSPTPHHHPHGQWSPAPTLLLRHAS